MNGLKKLIIKYEQTTSILERLGLLGQMIKEIELETKKESRKVRWKHYINWSMNRS